MARGVWETWLLVTPEKSIELDAQLKYAIKMTAGGEEICRCFPA
jgi:hypothetical protein